MRTISSVTIAMIREHLNLSGAFVQLGLPVVPFPLLK